MKEILIVTESLGVDGPERVISELASKWCEKGYEVKIFLTNAEHHEQTYFLPPSVTVEKIKSTGLKPIKLVRNAKIIRNYLKTKPNAVGLSLMLSTSFSLALAGIGLKNKIILSERNDPHKVPFKWHQRKMRDLSLWLADSVVFQTEDAKNYFCKTIREKGILIPNPVSSQLPQPYKEIRKKMMVAVGRLAKQKNFPMLLKAFKIFSDQVPDYKLTIYGEGPDRESLQSLIESLKLAEKVKMPGFSTNVYNEIVDSAAYISSSDFEGMSNSMLEAMAMGMPVICTDCPIGGARQMIRNGENGLLVPVGDAEALADAMIEVATDLTMSNRIGLKASELRDLLHIDNISRQWLSIM